MNVLNIIYRYEEVLRQRGIKKEDFYKQCGFTSAAVSQWRTGKTKPSADTIRTIAENLGLSYEFIAYGTEDIEEVNTAIRFGADAEAQKIIREAVQKIAELDKNLQDPKEQQILDFFRELPDDKKDTALEVIRAMAVASKAL